MLTGTYVSKHGDVYEIVQTGSEVKITNVFNRTTSYLSAHKIREDIRSGWLRRMP